MGRVLVIDDDRDCAEELAELLEHYGFRTGCAHSLAQARVKYADEPTEAVVIDVSLARENGIDLAVEWMDDPEPPKIVFLTGRALTPLETARFPGAPPPMLLKPADPDVLVSLLRN